MQGKVVQGKEGARKGACVTALPRALGAVSPRSTFVGKQACEAN